MQYRHRMEKRNYPPSHSRWMRSLALTTAATFTWTLILATPVQALTHLPKPKRTGVTGVRVLSQQEMQKIVGSVGYPGDPVSMLPWNGVIGVPLSTSVFGDRVNTFTGNKTTSLPIVSWTARGGLPVDFTLFHNSLGTHNVDLGNKWSHTFDIYMAVNPITNNMELYWGDGSGYYFTQNINGTYTPQTGIHDSLVKNGDGTYTLTLPDQTQYHFNTSLYCDSIKDENGNTISLAYNSHNEVSSITDPTNRKITLGYDSNNRINSITDPLNRQWSITYDSSGNLWKLSYPVINSTTYQTVLGYDTNHNPTSLQTPRGYSWTASFNSNSTLAWQKDPALNQTSYAYTSSTCTVTDPNSNQTVYTYDTSGRNTQVKDPLLYHEDYTWDTNNNRTKITDKRGYAWQYSYDSNGNVLTAKDPYLNTYTMTYNSHNKLLTIQQPTGEKTSYAYNSFDNLTGTSWQNSSGVTQASVSFTVNSYGLRTDYYDANNHHYQYGYSTNGDLTSQTTPLGNLTQWAYDALGFGTSRTDALNRTTSYTPDAWERLVTITYPDSSTHTFQYDVDDNLTQFVDATGTTTQAYDNCDRMTSESKGGSTVVSSSYDATGEKGLLSTITDSNGRVISLTYTSRKQLYQASETAGTETYSYDANGNETGITNQNSTTITETYDNASRLTGVTNKNSSGTVLSSFSYTLDTDNRRTGISESDGSTVTYSYDWNDRLTSESRTGTNPYNYSYVLDGVGNRTSETLGGVTTTLNYDADDELTSTSGGIVNSYGYNANGEQTSRTLSGTAYSLSFDYDGQLTSITQGSNTTSFSYDALNRRVSRTAGGVTTNFQYDDESVLLEKQGSSTTATYTYGNALIRKDGEYPLFDGLGSERTVTNSSQTVTGTVNYDSFSNTVGTTGSSSDPYMFAATWGYRSDGDAGLLQVGARYYDSQVGRFISRDTDLDQHPYIYDLHDPVNTVDPTGHQASIAIGAVGAGLAIPGVGEVLIGVGIGVAIGYGISKGIDWWRSRHTVPPGNFAKGGKQHIRDTGLVGEPDEVIRQKARDRSLPPDERERYKKEEKARQMRRNRQQKNN